MKKSVLVFSMVSVLLIGGMRVAVSQEQPKPKKDTVNIDTDAKPTFYYAEEEKAKSGGIPVIAIVAGAAVVIGIGAFLVLRKKKV